MFLDLWNLLKNFVLVKILRRKPASLFQIKMLHAYVVIDTTDPRIYIDQLFEDAHHAEKHARFCDEVFSRPHHVAKVRIEQRTPCVPSGPD